jgi:hypothetical protein
LQSLLPAAQCDFIHPAVVPRSPRIAYKNGHAGRSEQQSFPHQFIHISLILKFNFVAIYFQISPSGFFLL